MPGGTPPSVVPSMTTGVVMSGSGTSVTAICCGPPPGMAKVISASGAAAAFAAPIASRSEQSEIVQPVMSAWSSAVLTT